MNIFKFKLLTCQFKKLIFLLIFIFSSSVYTQNTAKELDSLITLLPKAKSHIRKVDLLYNISKRYQKNSIPKSDYYNKQLFEISKSNNYQVGIGYYELINTYNYCTKSKFDESLDAAFKAEKIFLNENRIDSYLDVVYFHAFTLYSQGKSNEALKLVLKEVNKSDNHKFSQQLGQLNYFLGYYYSSLNNLNKAIKYNLDALKFYRKVNNELGIIKCYYNMSDIYILTNQIDESEFYAKSCLNILNSSKNDITELSSGIYATLAEINIKRKQYKIAEEYCLKAIKINEKLKRDEFLGFDLIISMKIDVEQNQFDKLIEKANKVLKISKTDFNIINAYYFLGVANNHFKNYLEAYFFLNKALKSIDSNNQKSFKNIFKEIAFSERKLGKFDNAFKNMELYHRLDIIQFEEEKEFRINELQTEFDVNEKDIVIKNAKIEEQKKKLQIQKQKNVLIFFSCIIIFSAIASVVFIFSYRVIRRKNKLLQIEKNKVSQSLDERELLLKEIHHRVKNNLQIVMSLLSIQAKEGDKSNIDDFLEKSQSRIISMSLIHQSLYESERLDTIDFNDYINQLVINLNNVIDSNSKNISFTINCKEIYLDIQMAIPLGLIINELISNSYKHAFPNTSEGQITITINQIDKCNYCLEYNDNGIGLENSNKGNVKSLGLDLVRQLAKQLKGKVTIKNNNGTEIIVVFKEFKY